MNTIEAIKTMIMSVAIQMDTEEKESLLEALYDLTSEIDGQLIDEDEAGMYDEDEEEFVSTDYYTESELASLKKLNR